MAAADDFSDLYELGVDLGDDITEKFMKSSKYVQSVAGTLPNDVLLKLYGLYKQSLEGPCSTPKPSWYDLKAKSKWDSWKSLGNLSSNNAKCQYISIVTKMFPDWLSKDKVESWISVSCMPKPLNSNNIIDYIQHGDVENFTRNLKDEPIDSLHDGMGLLHYAADVGNIEMLELLLKANYNINLQDEEGQTALHYAASCGHANCIQLLLKYGANKTISDSNGDFASNVASDDEIKLLLT